ncbi:hypothetical protein H632_c1828p0, partial [Helicosporidium sp. ATCC 50920]
MDALEDLMTEAGAGSCHWGEEQPTKRADMCRSQSSLLADSLSYSPTTPGVCLGDTFPCLAGELEEEARVMDDSWICVEPSILSSSTPQLCLSEDLLEPESCLTLAEGWAPELPELTSRPAPSPIRPSRQEEAVGAQLRFPPLPERGLFVRMDFEGSSSGAGPSPLGHLPCLP